MHIALFGATGKTGQPLVTQALAAGHTVHALVRDPARLQTQHERLIPVVGDVSKAQSVAEAVAGCDAVITTIGHVKGSPSDIQTVATRNILAAMQQHSVTRIVSLTGAGVRAPQDTPKFSDRAVRLALSLLPGNILGDGEQHAQLLTASNVEWVIARGPMLTQGPRSAYKVGFVGQGSGLRLARENLADFILRNLTDNTYLRRMPLAWDA